ncbi:MAG: response regulator [Marinilabiliales bacterium]|nr:MAG: response regulator [Marinilabiliales bacterium]
MAKEKKSILVVDDSETNLVLMEALLADKGWELSKATSGKTALGMISKSKPDLILLDLLMPGIDGNEMLDRLKAGEQTADIPVIVISAVHNSEARITCLEKGALDYLTKPVNINEMLKKVEKVLEE